MIAVSSELLGTIIINTSIILYNQVQSVNSHIISHVLSADDEFLNLISSLVDLENFGVSHKLLNRVILVVTVSAKYLDSISSVLVCSDGAV